MFLIYIQVTGVDHVIFFGKGEEEKMAAGEVEWGKRCGQGKLIIASSKACFFPPHCQTVLFS